MAGEIAALGSELDDEVQRFLQQIEDANPTGQIAHATRLATAQLNARSRPWIWGRPQIQGTVLPPTLVYSL